MNTSKKFTTDCYLQSIMSYFLKGKDQKLENKKKILCFVSEKQPQLMVRFSKCFCSHLLALCSSNMRGLELFIKSSPHRLTLAVSLWWVGPSLQWAGSVWLSSLPWACPGQCAPAPGVGAEGLGRRGLAASLGSVSCDLGQVTDLPAVDENDLCSPSPYCSGLFNGSMRQLHKGPCLRLSGARVLIVNRSLRNHPPSVCLCVFQD